MALEVSDQLIQLSELLKEWNGMLSVHDFHHDKSSTLESYIEECSGITSEMSKELEAVCGVDTLDCDEEVDSLQNLLKTVPVNTDLHTLSAHKKYLEACQAAGRSGTLSLYRSRKYKFMIPDVIHKMQEEIESAGEEHEGEITTPDLLVRVKIYRPFHVSAKTPTNMQIIPMQEYDVLGSQNLTCLRDAIQCLDDYCIPGEFSTDPDTPKDVKTKDLYKSGFFYIEGTFYNDTRDPAARDYSKVIIDWAKDPSRGIGPFEIAHMQNHTFLDLKIRIGQPYVYMHQGDCEHILLFSDIRLIHPDDCVNPTRYPLLVDRLREKRILCRACLTNSATWVTRDSPLVPEDPCFFCDTCLKGLHYDQQGKKIVEFKAYPYVNKALLNDGIGLAKPFLKSQEKQDQAREGTNSVNHAEAKPGPESLPTQ